MAQLKVEGNQGLDLHTENQDEKQSLVDLVVRENAGFFFIGKKDQTLLVQGQRPTCPRSSSCLFFTANRHT